MKHLILIFLALLNLSLFAQELSKQEYLYPDSVITAKNGKTIVLKSKKFYDYQVQKNLAATELQKSGNLQIAGQICFLVSAGLVGLSVAREDPPMTIIASGVAGLSIPLMIASGIKKRKAAKELKKASFYQFE